MELEVFEHTLKQALAHLYDPAYSPPEQFWLVLGVASVRDRQSLHAAISDAIHDMQPEKNVPDTARIWRYYDLLSSRYIHELTQKETAQRLNISPRHLRREQQQAVQVLAQRLWQKHYAPAPDVPVQTVDRGDLSDPWAVQVRQELAALHDSDPNMTAHVSSELLRALKLVQAVSDKRGISLSLVVSDEELVAEIHPSVLRQILITAMEDLVEHMRKGIIELRARRSGDEAEITLIAEPLSSFRDDYADSLWSTLAEGSGASDFSRTNTRGTICFRFPLARQISVVVIDDNKDVVHVYRRYTAGTQYYIEHLVDLSDVITRITETQPDLIVLDVMMPDVDGWELLIDLHQHPSTSGIPVIVCSVIRREELAMALGAAAHLSKPVKSEQFLETLDRVWQSASATWKQGEMHSPI